MEKSRAIGICRLFMNATQPTPDSRDAAAAEQEAFIAARRPQSMPAVAPAGSPLESGASAGSDAERESAAQALRAPGVEVEEHHSRSVLKAVSWRVTGTLDTMLISYLVTGNLAVAASIGFLEVFTKMALYYVHERVWSKLQFGRKIKEIPPPDYQI